MIKFYSHREIDQERWDRAIFTSSYPTLFAQFDFLSIASPNWCALIRDDYDYVMPLPVNSKMWLKYIYTPFFISRLGIYSSSAISAKIADDFLSHIPKIYKHIDLILNSSNSALSERVSPICLKSHDLSLHNPYSVIQKRYSENTKRNIKGAHKNELSLQYNISTETIIDLFKNGRGKSRSVHYQKKDYSTLVQLADCALQKERLDRIGVVDQQGRVLAGALFLRDYRRIWFWFSGRDQWGADQKAMFFLLDEYFKINENQELMFDFNGSMNENIARFYKGFGAESYPVNMLNIRKFYYLSPFVKIYQSLKK